MILANEVEVFNPNENSWSTVTKLMKVDLPINSTIL